MTSWSVSPVPVALLELGSLSFSYRKATVSDQPFHTLLVGTYTSNHTFIHIHIPAYTQVSIHSFTHTHTLMHTYTLRHMQIHTSAHTFINTYAHTHAYIHTQTYADV